MLSFNSPADVNDSMAQPGCMLSFNIPEDNCVSIDREGEGPEQEIGIDLPSEDQNDMMNDWMSPSKKPSPIIIINSLFKKRSPFVNLKHKS